MCEKFVVTISHLLGCGGSDVGKKLSKDLAVPFVDRQILKLVSDHLKVPEEDIESREERATSFWDSFMRMEAFNATMAVMEAHYYPNEKELYDLESEIIEQIVQKGSAIILGHGGRYILRNFEKHFSVFVHADLNDRIQRVSELYHISDNEAKKTIEKNDKERNAYIKSFTSLELLDARTYDICINTSSIGLYNAVEIIKSSLKNKLGL
jgi:cytidylate kinase